MKPPRVATVCFLGALFALIPAAWAQQNSPHLGYVYPAGCRQGTTCQVKVGGQFLVNVAAVYVSGDGIEVTVVDYNRPLNPQQMTQLREKLQELQKGPRNVETMQQMAEIRAQILTNMRKNQNPVLSESVTLQLVIAAGAGPGERELKLATPQGVSNPLVFCVGQLPESTEAPLKMSMEPQVSPANAETNITLPATVNGQITPNFLALPRAPATPGQQFAPGDVDRYRFQARQGQQLVIAAAARELMPYLADAVPGWFSSHPGTIRCPGERSCVRRRLPVQSGSGHSL